MYVTEMAIRFGLKRVTVKLENILRKLIMKSLDAGVKSTEEVGVAKVGLKLKRL